MAHRFRLATLFRLAVLLGILNVAAWPASADGEATPTSDATAAAASPKAWSLEEIEEPERDGKRSQRAEPSPWEKRVDGFFGTYLVAPLETVLFFDFWTGQWLNRRVQAEVDCPKCQARFQVKTLQPWDGTNLPTVVSCPKCAPDGDAGEMRIITGTSVPLVVLWLLVGAIFFTLRMGFINVRAFRHAIRLTRGDYDNPEETGEVSHFQALASALSATIGLGNIAGVAIAVGNGGPGAIFWMIVAGLLGMSSKFAECSLSQMYRKVAPDGTVSGGPMHYLHAGLKEIRVGHSGLDR